MKSLMLAVAVVLHGMVAMIPMPNPGSPAKKPLESVKVARLSKLRLPQPRSAPLLRKAIPQPKTPPLEPVTTSIPPTPAPNSPKPTPTPSPQQLPEKLPEKSPPPPLIEGAVQGCNGLPGCWQVEETNGRSVSAKLEEVLIAQGYHLTPKDLEDDHMQVYEVTKDGKFQHYLHLVWNEQGTTYVQAQELLSRAALEERKVHREA